MKQYHSTVPGYSMMVWGYDICIWWRWVNMCCIIVDIDVFLYFWEDDNVYIVLGSTLYDEWVDMFKCMRASVLVMWMWSVHFLTSTSATFNLFLCFGLGNMGGRLRPIRTFPLLATRIVTFFGRVLHQQLLIGRVPILLHGCDTFPHAHV